MFLFHTLQLSSLVLSLFRAFLVTASNNGSSSSDQSFDAWSDGWSTRFKKLFTKKEKKQDKTKQHVPLQNKTTYTKIRNQPNFELFRKRFQHVLMVVCVNWKSPIDVLIVHDDLWKSVMKNVVYYGPFDKQFVRDMNEKSLKAVSRSDYEVAPEGTLAYRAALDAINRFPHFDGYLFKHDDLHINVTAMSSWNISSVWASKSFLYPIKNFTHPEDGAEWWFNHPRAGLNAIMNSLEGNNEFADKLTACTGSNDTWPAVLYIS